VTILKFKDGRVGKVASVIDCLQPYYFHVHLVGSEGSLLDNKFYSTRQTARQAKWSELSMKLLDSGDVSDHPYQTQFEAFLRRSIRQGDAADEFDRCVVFARCIFAADRSADLHAHKSAHNDEMLRLKGMSRV